MRGAVEAHRQRGAADRLGPVLLGEAPLGRHRGQPPAQQVAVVDLAEARRGVEQAEPDVGGAVAHAEDPAVAGQQRVAVPQVEPGLEVVVVMPGRGVIGADRDPERPVVALVQAHSDRQPGGVAVGGDDQPAAELLAVPGGHPGDPAVLSSSSGPVTLTPSSSRAPAFSACRARIWSKSSPGPDQAVAGIAGQVGPVQLDPAAAADDPQALVAQPAIALGDRHAHGGQRLDRARGQSVAADLLSREVVFSRSSTSSPA